MSLSRLALVTGGANGLGAATVKSLARREFRVIVVDLDADAAAGLVDDLGAAHVEFHRLDVCDDDAVGGLAAQVRERHGALDVLVNNVGTVAPQPSHRMDTVDWTAQLDIHFGTGVRFSANFVDLLAQRPGAAIVNVSSIAGHRGFPARLAYSAAKAAVEAATRTLAVEWAGLGIRVNAVAPGFVLTDMARDLYERGVADRAAREQLVPLGRMGRPEEIGEAVTWLAIDATYVTGHVLVVDGGFLADGRTGEDPAVLSAGELRADLARRHSGHAPY